MINGFLVTIFFLRTWSLCFFLFEVWIRDIICFVPIQLTSYTIPYLTHPLFDELHDPNSRLPNGCFLVPLFNLKTHGIQPAWQKKILSFALFPISVFLLILLLLLCLIQNWRGCQWRRWWNWFQSTLESSAPSLDCNFNEERCKEETVLYRSHVSFPFHAHSSLFRVLCIIACNNRLGNAT